MQQESEANTQTNTADLTDIETFHEGLLVLNDPAGGGMACVLTGCDNPKCMCRDVQVRAVSFGPWVRDVKLDQGDLRFIGDEGEHGDLSDLVELRLDVDQGNLFDEDGDPFDLEAQPRLRLLEQAIDGPFLDEMARRLSRHKGLEIDEVGRHVTLDMDHWKSGDNVYWREVFREVRQDVYLSDEGKAYMADDMYCANPDCDCAEAAVSFLGEDDAVGIVHVELGSDNVWFEPDSGQEVLLQALWRRYHQRHHGIARLERREIEMKKFGAETLYAKPASVRREQRKVGRNAPCPCGSGKKYKKCCLRQANPS